MTSKTGSILKYYQYFTVVVFPKYSPRRLSCGTSKTRRYIICHMARSRSFLHKSFKIRNAFKSIVAIYYMALILKKRARIRQRNVIHSKYLKNPKELGWCKLYNGNSDEAFLSVTSLTAGSFNHLLGIFSEHYLNPNKTS
jgi:hypothetical protein